MTKLYLNVFLLSIFCATSVQASTFDDVGYTQLKTELGANLPKGAGVKVAHIEVADDEATPAWIPDMANSEFNLKIFTEIPTGSIGFSDHANSVAKKFYGNGSSMAPGVTEIDSFEVNSWLGSGFLNTGAGVPTISATRLANHSWAGSVDTFDPDVLRRVDFVVEQDEFIHVVAMITSPLLSNSFNAIAVGLSKGSGVGTLAIDSVYVAGRARPDIVAPENWESISTPRVASAAALLIDYANNTPSLSTDPLEVSTTNRNGDVISNAARSETIKAVLMAGADRNTLGNTNSVDITDYRVDAANQTSNGLDARFGAGQLNIYNSYHILAAGEQNSVEDAGSTLANAGFDYDPSFGGLSSSNIIATYSFTTSAIGGQKLKAALVWNLNAMPSTPVLYDMDLQLIDVSDGSTVYAESTSTIDNTENIWVDLISGNDYQLKVIRGTGQGDFDWDYALAWQIVVPGVTVVETDSSTITAENGTTDTFTLVLDSPPTDDVVITLTSSNVNEATVLPASVTFTSSNWSTLQTVTVTGINDVIDDGDINYNINFAVNSTADTNYDGMTVASVAASNSDDDATFSFVDQSDVALNTLITSNTFVVTGLLNATAISIAGGEYSINGGGYTSIAGTINNNDTVTVQATSSADGLTPVNVTLTIGDVSDTFTVTTEVDTDVDGVGDSLDNCTLIANDQLDTDGDGYGNACDGDFNNDDIVNSLDIGLFKADFFKTGAQDADLNGDSIVNSLDIGLFKDLFFTAPGPSGLVP